MDRLAAMEAFACVVETGSFSAAARRLGVGQPSISKAVSQLEQRFGVRLLLRSSRRLAPTEAGRSFYEHARPTLDRAELAEAAVRSSGRELSGRLRIAAPVTFARLHVVPKLQLLLDLHPELDVEVILDDREVDLIEMGIDVALRLGSLADSALTARCITRCRRVVLGTPPTSRVGEGRARLTIWLTIKRSSTSSGTAGRHGPSAAGARSGRWW